MSPGQTEPWIVQTVKQILGTQAHSTKNNWKNIAQSARWTHSQMSTSDVVWRITDEEKTFRSKGEGTAIAMGE